MTQRMRYGTDTEKMLQYIQDYLSRHDMPQSRAALPFAVKMHEGQIRCEGLPYIIHPLTMVCHALAAQVREDTMIAVLLLHDVCEDCDVSVEELPVDENVRYGVHCMTCLRQPGESKEDMLSRYYSQIRRSREASIGKLFDRCHNVSSMAKAFSGEKMIEYRQETIDYVFPLIEFVKKEYPEMEEVVFLLEYQIRSVLDTVACVVDHS